jgi:hypothetical protein
MREGIKRERKIKGKKKKVWGYMILLSTVFSWMKRQAGWQQLPDPVLGCYTL